jgi:hypothetical protein
MHPAIALLGAITIGCPLTIMAFVLAIDYYERRQFRWAVRVYRLARLRL